MAGGNWREQKRSFSLHSRIEVTMMANRQGKLTELLLREEGMGGRKGNLCNGWIPRVWGEQIEQIALRVNQKFLPKLKSARTNNKTNEDREGHWTKADYLVIYGRFCKFISAHSEKNPWCLSEFWIHNFHHLLWKCQILICISFPQSQNQATFWARNLWVLNNLIF